MAKKKQPPRDVWVDWDAHEGRVGKAHAQRWPVGGGIGLDLVRYIRADLATAKAKPAKKKGAKRGKD